MSKNTRTNNSIDFSWLIKTNWYPKSPLHKLFIDCCRIFLVVEGHDLWRWSKSTLGGSQADGLSMRSRLTTMVSPTTPWFVWFPTYSKMIELFGNSFPGQQWCYHVCFSSSVHGQTRADCFREVWICPPFFLKVAFHLASCMIESSITNRTSPKRERRHDKLVGHRIVPSCLICRSPVVWPVAPLPSSGTDIILVKKRLCQRSFVAKKSGEKV